jgi:hypothetical protein
VKVFIVIFDFALTVISIVFFASLALALLS